MKKKKYKQKNKLMLPVFISLMICILLILLFNRISSDTNIKYLGNFKNGYVSISDGIRYGYLSSSGKKIFPLENKLPKKIGNDSELSQYYYIDDIAPYYKDGKYGIINNKGEIIVTAKYNAMQIYSKDTIVVTENKDTYIINSKGERLIGENYFSISGSYIYPASFIVENRELKYGIMDMNSGIKKELVYDDISRINNSTETDFIYKLKQNNNIELYTKKLKKIEIDTVVDVLWYEKNVVCYSDNNIIHTFNISTGKDDEYDSSYSYVGYYSNDLAVAVQNNKILYIDTNKKEVIKTNYDYGDMFQFGYAKVCLNEKCGVINYFGDEIIPLDYDEINIINDNKILVAKNNKSYIIDNNNTKLSEEYNNIEVVNDGKYYIVKNDKYGILDATFHTLYDLEYDKIRYSDNNFVMLKNNKIETVTIK